MYRLIHTIVSAYVNVHGSHHIRMYRAISTYMQKYTRILFLNGQPQLMQAGLNFRSAPDMFT